MEILKAGRSQRGWTVQTTCTGSGNGGGGCEAELLVSAGDVFATFTNCRDESERHATFECISCGVLTDLPRDMRLPFTPQPRPKRGESEK